MSPVVGVFLSGILYYSVSTGFAILEMISCLENLVRLFWSCPRVDVA